MNLRAPMKRLYRPVRGRRPKILVAALVVPAAVAFMVAQVVFAAPPTASFTISETTPMVGQAVTFNASSSSDLDGDITTYEWDFEYDGTTFNPDPTATDAHPSHTYNSAGPRSVALRVTDGVTTDGTVSSEIRVEALRVNTPPVPGFIHEPLTPVVNEPIQFASTSSDPDTPEALTYDWDLDGDGAFGETTPLERGPNPLHAFATPGQKTVTLRVTDSGGVARELSRTITVQLSVPNGAFTVSPDAPLPGEPVSFTSTSSPSAGRQITSAEWDFDYDIATGNFTADATGASATHAFGSPGPKRVAIRVTEGPAGGFDIETLVVVVNAAPQADFAVVPGSPVAGDVVTISSISSDPDGPLTKQEWDLDDDGQFDDAAGTLAQASFPKARAYRVHLRVTDSKGATSTVSREVKVRRRPLFLLSGVLITMKGRLVGASTDLTRLLVRAPRGTRVSVRCLPPGKAARAAAACPKRAVRKSKGHRLRFRVLEGRLAPGTKVIVAVTRPGFLGRYTVFRMRASKEPLRRDRCIAPGARHPTRCPGS
jgi:PKD repeat protein